MVSEIWAKILPAGEHALDWDGIKILYNMFKPNIDKINAPNTDAHWNFEETSAKAAHDFSCNIFGYEGKFTL